MQGRGRRGNSPIQTHHCLCVKSQSVCTAQKTRREESRQECGCLRILVPPSIWLCQFQHAHVRPAVDSVFYSNANQIFYWVSAEQSLSGPPGGIGCITVVKLVLSCQAGTSLATKAQLFHDPDSTTGRDGGVLVNPSLCSAETST